MNSMTLFTMPRIGLENSIRTIEKDNRSRVSMGFHQLTRSSIRYRGFTLIELLVTLAIVAVIAAPSLQNFVLNNRIRAQADDTDCTALTLTHLGEESATGGDPGSCW